MSIPIPDKIESIWTATAAGTTYPTLEEDLEIDAAVIGGGMAGLNIAYFLTEQGLKVTLVETGKLAAATSGNTTAKVTSLHGLRYGYLTQDFGKDKAQIYADSNEWAVDKIQEIIQKEGIECDFYRAPSFTYTKNEQDLARIKQETEASLDLGLPASFVNNISGISFDILGAVKFDNQGYFHPRKYLLKIAEVISSKGCLIWENTQAQEIKEDADFCLVKTANASIKARYVVVATNFPFYDPSNIFSKLERLGSFVVAVQPKIEVPEIMVIGTRSLDMSFRPHKEKGEKWMIVGARHEEKFGNKSMQEHFEILATLAHDNFKADKVGYKWGAADTMSRDKVPYIGKMPKSKNIYVATGFSAWGMTPSVVSAKLVTDMIMGEKNEWESLYTPERLVTD